MQADKPSVGNIQRVFVIRFKPTVSRQKRRIPIEVLGNLPQSLNAVSAISAAAGVFSPAPLKEYGNRQTKRLSWTEFAPIAGTGGLFNAFRHESLLQHKSDLPLVKLEQVAEFFQLDAGRIWHSHHYKPIIGLLFKRVRTAGVFPAAPLNPQAKCVITSWSIRAFSPARRLNAQDVLRYLRDGFPTPVEQKTFCKAAAAAS